MRHLLTLTCLLLATATLADESDFDFSSLGAKKALRDYNKAIAKDEKAQAQQVKKAEAEGAEEIKKTRDAFVENLRKALKQSMQAGNLEEANKINAAIKALEQGAGPAAGLAVGSKGKKSKTRIPRDSDSPLLYRFFEYDQKNNGFAVRTNARGFSELVQLESYRGKEHVLQTHPRSESNPAIFSKVLRIPRSGRYALRMGVSHHIHDGINRDWMLVVRVNGISVMQQVVGEAIIQNGWADIEVNLRRFAGRKVEIEIIHAGGGPESNWNGEHGYWTHAEIVKK